MAAAWTALVSVAYSDLELIFRYGAVGWLGCAAIWVLSWLLRQGSGQALRRSSGKAGGPRAGKKLKRVKPRSLAIGAAAGVAFAAVVLTGYWFGKSEHSSARTLPARESQPLNRASAVDRPPGDSAERHRDGTWSVQVGSLRNEQEAKKIARALTDRGWDAYVTRANVNGKVFYRIHVGRFKTRVAAEKLLLKLKDREGYSEAFVASM
ncbi:MAG TPA: SPOR domain-containing protein [Candidatus Acidoferrales bacterium]|nr:SPOR domain-containing protein [Candidatus Acidoferrales bacterium]